VVCLAHLLLVLFISPSSPPQRRVHPVRLYTSLSLARVTLLHLRLYVPARFVADFRGLRVFCAGWALTVPLCRRNGRPARLCLQLFSCLLWFLPLCVSLNLLLYLYRFIYSALFSRSVVWFSVVALATPRHAVLVGLPAGRTFRFAVAGGCGCVVILCFWLFADVVCWLPPPAFLLPASRALHLFAARGNAACWRRFVGYKLFSGWTGVCCDLVLICMLSPDERLRYRVWCGNIVAYGAAAPLCWHRTCLYTGAAFITGRLRTGTFLPLPPFYSFSGLSQQFLVRL